MLNNMERTLGAPQRVGCVMYGRYLFCRHPFLQLL